MTVTGHLETILKEKKTVVSRAKFWKISHNTKGDDICLKLGRYTRGNFGEQLESSTPKSELTLDHDEFNNLIEFIKTNYEPFKSGTKAFIPLDKPYDITSAEQIKKFLSLPDKDEVLSFIMEHDVIPEYIELGLIHARKIKAVNEFEEMLQGDFLEKDWQKWFEKNSWVLGSEFVQILEERPIDSEHISDFLMKAFDGFVDIVEIKRPGGNLEFWAKQMDHKNYVPHSDLVKAITQATKYIYELEREANSIKFLERVGGKVIKPRCVLIFGRSNTWFDEQKEAFRILNSSYHNLTIMTFDHVLERAKRIIGIEDDIPF